MIERADGGIKRADGAVIESVTAADLLAAADGLAGLLCDVTDSGSSVGFLAPLDPAEAKAWWLALIPDLESGGVLLWMARAADGRVVGTVQLRPSPMPNGAHRAELAKLMVHTTARGQGLGRALLATAEHNARTLGLRLLVLDTEEGSSAEPLYRAAGWTESGRIPNYAANPQGEPRATIYYHRTL